MCCTISKISKSSVRMTRVKGAELFKEPDMLVARSIQTDAIAAALLLHRLSNWREEMRGRTALAKGACVREKGGSAHGGSVGKRCSG